MLCPLQRLHRCLSTLLIVLSADAKAEKDSATSLDGAGGDCGEGNILGPEAQGLGVSAHTWSLGGADLISRGQRAEWGQGGEGRSCSAGTKLYLVKFLLIMCTVNDKVCCVFSVV